MDFVTTHPLDPQDAPIVTAMRAMVSSTKGMLRGIAARVPFDALMERVSPREDVKFESDAIGGIPGLWVHPAHCQLDEAILHLHGGWFNLGTAKAYRHLVAHIAARVGASAFIPDYRLAPEYPFPAAVDDVLACYGGIVERGIRRIAVTGDSAGGNLALVLASRVARDSVSAKRTLVGAVALSPVTDLTLSGATYETRADADPFFTRPRWRNWCVPIWGAPIRKIHWLRRSTRDFRACPQSAFTSETTRCCWMIRVNISSAPSPPESMHDSMCGWGCHTASSAASES